MGNTIEAQLERANKLKNVLAKQIPNEYCGIKFDNKKERQLMQTLFGKDPQAVIGFYKLLRDNSTISQLIHGDYEDITKRNLNWEYSILPPGIKIILKEDEKRTLFVIVKKIIKEIKNGVLAPESFVIRNTDEAETNKKEVGEMSKEEYKRHISGIMKELGGKKEFFKKFQKVIINIINLDYHGNIQAFLKEFSQDETTSDKINELVIEIVKQLFNINSKDESSVKQFDKRLNNKQHYILTWFIYDELEKFLHVLPKIIFENNNNVEYKSREEN